MNSRTLHRVYNPFGWFGTEEPNTPEVADEREVWIQTAVVVHGDVVELNQSAAKIHQRQRVDFSNFC